MKLLTFGALLLTIGAAHADCTFATGPCSTDSAGNTYRTEKNFGGGYTTYRNGSRYSTTTQTLGGGWRERNVNGGGTRMHNSDPYGPLFGSQRRY